MIFKLPKSNICSDYRRIPEKPNMCLCLCVFVVHTIYILYIAIHHVYTIYLLYILIHHVQICICCIQLYTMYILIYSLYRYIHHVQMYTSNTYVYILSIDTYIMYRYIHYVYTMCRLCICSLYQTMKYTIYGIIMVFLWYMGIFMIFKMVYLWYIYGIFMVYLWYAVKIWNYYGILLMFHVKHWKPTRQTLALTLREC